MIITIASAVSGLIGVAIIFLGLRFLLSPQAAAAGYGIEVQPRGAALPDDGPYPWLHVKGVRDVASGIFTLILLANRTPHVLGAFMAAASIIPLGDAVINLRDGGSRTAAFGIHGATALVMLAAAAALLLAGHLQEIATV